MRLSGSETVLAVDDDATMLDLLEEVLKPLGYEVLSAASGEEALQMAASCLDKIDLLLTDVVLPGIKGQDLAKQLTSKCPGMIVLFMSGYLCPSMAHRDAGKRYEAFIQKPFSPNELLRKIRLLLD
jgi:two-component system cell cycle sensor histidine kinase/response regulator CckA